MRLKDAQSQIPAVIWRSSAQRLTFWPESGMEVSGIARIRVYRKGGYYQLDIQRLQPAGVGALYAAFEALKKRLQKEGLFAPERKRPLPRTVCRLGVVTSKTGAAIRDIVRVVSARSPRTDIVLRNVRVQGDGAADEIATAVHDFNRHGKVDLLIVGRGGGSIEDLWAFNEEVVARAVFDSSIPVISAVGHETDFTIADFVADMRAATPSAAAEMAVPDDEESRRYFQALARQFFGGYVRHFRGERERLERALMRPALRRPGRMLLENRQELDSARDRAFRDLGVQLKAHAGQIRGLAGRLEALSPLRVLSRGYSVAMKEDGSAIRDSAQVRTGERIALRFHRGQARACIESTEPSAATGDDPHTGE